jgi:hypothetical protein
MELKMPYPDAKVFQEAYGISEERTQEISRSLDALINSYGRAPVLVYFHHTVFDIASFCKGPEEFAYALILHCGLLQRRGQAIAPR